jgi:cytochrome b involved in lipid metabolism
MKKKYSIKYSPIENTEYELILKKRNLPKYNMEEVKKHNKELNAWVVVDNYILDVTNFINDHPGGADQFNDRLGTDITDIWHQYHHKSIMKNWFGNLLIGVLK